MSNISKLKTLPLTPFIKLATIDAVDQIAEMIDITRRKEKETA